MDNEFKVMRSGLDNINTLTEGLVNMMSDLTSKTRSNRDNLLAGVEGVQERMKKAGFSLAELEVCVHQRNEWICLLLFE